MKTTLTLNEQHGEEENRNIYIRSENKSLLKLLKLERAVLQLRNVIMLRSSSIA